MPRRIKAVLKAKGGPVYLIKWPVSVNYTRDRQRERKVLVLIIILILNVFIISSNYFVYINICQYNFIFFVF